MTEQPAAPPAGASTPEMSVPAAEDGAVLEPRRQPGDPHPYMLQRNPPNLWILAAMTVGALVTAVIVLVLTVLL